MKCGLRIVACEAQYNRGAELWPGSCGVQGGSREGREGAETGDQPLAGPPMPIGTSLVAYEMWPVKLTKWRRSVAWELWRSGWERRGEGRGGNRRPVPYGVRQRLSEQA
jgi:hypothetical protein